MQELEYPNAKRLDERVRHQYEIPPQTTGVKVEVIDYKGAVCLTVNGADVLLTIQGARDLALALRQSANRVERER